MSLPISNVIRHLRRERDITQEELAAAVGVTYQSVSRWENGQAYPDMELIPKIAQYFDISTDILFGTDSDSASKKLDDHYQKIKEVQDNPEEFYQACKAAYNDFPREFSFGLWLLRCYIDYNIRPYEKHLETIRSICKNIIDNCTNEDYRIEAISKIAVAEDEEHLNTWLSMMPGWKSCKEILLETRYSYHNDLEKCNLQRQENFKSFLGYIFYNCTGMGDLADASERFQLILKLIDVMRDTSTDVDAWLPMRADFHLRLAGINFGMKQHDSGYAELEKAINLYVKYADLPMDTILAYNCPLLNMLTENKLSTPEDDTKDKGEYVCWWAYHTLTGNDGLFGNVQGEKRYKEQIEKLVPCLPKSKTEQV